MTWHKVISTGGLMVFLMMGLAQPHEAAAATPPLLVQETEAQLVTAGCERVKVADAKAMQAAGALDWQAVVSSDATGEALLFCPPSVVGENGLPKGDGQVAGLTAYAAQNANPLDNSWDEWLQRAVRYMLPGAGLLAEINDAVAFVFWLFFTFLAKVAQWLIYTLSTYIEPLLSLSSFVNNEVVRKAWPVVLGVANMGFLLALVLIALLTTLRLEVGGGVRRLLPRLLIAALLVNFSLVIGGVILDASRIIMALIPPIFDSSFDSMATMLVLKANMAIIFYNVQQSLATGFSLDSAALSYINPVKGWDQVLATILNAVVAWIIALALAVVIVGLLIRYLMLLLLLIVSPLAYLFVALPGASGLAKRWWTMFMRYVIYGPVVLFILMAALSVDELIDVGGFFDVSNANEEIAIRQRAYWEILGAAVFSAALVAAAMAGRYAGIVGSATAIGIATGTGRRVRGIAYGGAKGIAKGVAAPVTVPARFAAKEGRRYLGKQAQGFLGAAGARIMAGFGYGKGAPPPGKKLGERVFGKPLTREQRGQAAAAKAFVPTGATQAQRDASVRGSTAWTPNSLRQEHVGGSLSQAQRESIMDMENTKENRAYKVALAGNAEAVKNMTAGERSKIEMLDVNMRVDLPTTGVDDATAAANGDQNRKNAIENEINRATQKAYYSSLDRLHRQSQAPTTP